MSEPNGGFFPITSVHRYDLEAMGFDIAAIDDATMLRLASKMADAYLDQAYWDHLAIIADELGIPNQAA